MRDRPPSVVPLYAIYGASGCGRGVMPVADAMLRDLYGRSGYDLVFVDDAPPGPRVNGRRVLSYADFVEAQVPSRAICIAIADTHTRERLAEVCQRDGIESFSVTAANAIVMDNVKIAEGAILAPFVTLTSNIQIGRHFHANIYSYVEHDCLVGDFVTFAPGVHCNGNVIIEDHAYLGAGCILRQGEVDSPLVIGRAAVVGMGAVVTRSVPPAVTVVGNPARALRKL